MDEVKLKYEMKKEDELAFQGFENKVNEVVKILEMMNSTDKEEQQTGTNLADRFLGTDPSYTEKLGKDDFIVKVRQDRTVINKKDESSDLKDDPQHMDKFVFMAEMERDANRRAKERKERQDVAQNFRSMGNQAFRKKEYEKAISFYTKAIDQVKDSPILYNNRALSYIRLGLAKRAITDCDFVINKLDEKNLRSWLYRAKAYYSLGELRDYDKSIADAKKNNPKELDYIEKIVMAIENESDLFGENNTLSGNV